MFRLGCVSIDTDGCVEICEIKFVYIRVFVVI